MQRKKAAKVMQF